MLSDYATICLLVCVVSLAVIAVVAFLEVLRCGKHRQTLYARIIEMMEEHAKNNRDLTEKVNGSIVSVGKIMYDFHKYFERTALIQNPPPLVPEEPQS